MPPKIVNRGWLLHQVLAERMEAQIDYRYDEVTGEFTGGSWLPARIIANPNDFNPSFVNLYRSAFRSRSGIAWRNRDGTFTLWDHSDCSDDYTDLRMKENL